MISFQKEAILQYCPLNQGCKEKTCDKKHPRQLIGICINYLQSNCNMNNCRLQHKQISDWKKQFQIPAINGIHQFNICQNQCHDTQCIYLHPDWSNLICWQCLNDLDCQRNDGIEHNWQWLREQVYEIYNQKGINPENICNCTKRIQCPNFSHNLQLENYCIPFFKGICPNLVCQKPHLNWENFTKGQIPYGIEDQVLKPCIKIDQQSQVFKQQPQTYIHNVYQKREELQMLNNRIKEQPIIDIIFILDCTYSMKKQIQEAKDNICAIIDEFKRKIPKSTVRVAAVCYRDFNDKPQHIFYHNFTTRVELIQQFIQLNEAKGGDDLPEDLVGALERAYQLNISNHKDSMLQLFIVTDAPCHGRYHNLLIDDYRENQEGKLENILQKFLKLKVRLFVTFFQISKNTLQMEGVMKKILKNSFNTAAINNSSLKDQVKFSLELSYQEGSKMNLLTNSFIMLDARYTKQGTMKFNYDQQRNQSTYMNYFNQQFDTEKIVSQATLQIEKNEVNLETHEQGTTFTIFKAFDIKNNRYVVLKIPKLIVEQFQKGELTKEKIQETESEAKTKYKQQVIAVQLAQEFNLRVREAQLKGFIVPIYYASPLLYEFEKPFQGLTLIYGETYINCENVKWRKYTSNYDYADQTTNIPSFSHFTYEVTQHEIMVTDLQGKFNLLSDPAIHSNINELISNNNCYQQGIDVFFQGQHQKCGIICQKLNLCDSMLLSTQIIDPERNQQQDIKQEIIDYENLYIICSNCGRQDEYQDQHPDFCKQCDYESKQDKKSMKCSCCKQIFQQNCGFKLMQTSMIQICDPCLKKQCLTPLLKCQYCKVNVCSQFKHQYIIDKTPIILCQDAIRYLQSLKCQNCHKDYAFQTLLTDQSYSQGQYYCCNK